MDILDEQLVSLSLQEEEESGCSDLTPVTLSEDYFEGFQLNIQVNPCENNGGCGLGSLCLIKPGGQQRVCACPEHFHLSVDKT